MIKKAVYSLWETADQKINGGFARKQDLAVTLTLSVELAKKQFETVELVTNTYGKELLIDKYKIPFDSVRVELDCLNEKLNPDLWAYAKILAYSIQEEPFIHIDNDVLIWDKISKENLEKDLFFQNKEHLSTHISYLRLLNEAKFALAINRDILNSNPTFAYNCGVVGVNNLELIAEWKQIVDEYLFDEENQHYWSVIDDKHSHNHLFEQFFISALIKNKAIEDKVSTLLNDNFMQSAIEDFKFTHLWGEAKRNQVTMQKVKNRLFLDYPQYITLFNQQESHSDIFDDIYKNELWGKGQGSGGGSSVEITEGYRSFLQHFLSDMQIKSVVDLGCGDWQFSELIDWSNVEYLGLDCVKSLIHTNETNFGGDNISFKYFDGSKEMLKEKGDLLIVKDVLIHWTNEEVSFFLKHLSQLDFKYILITNQIGKENLNSDIQTGQFRNIDINSEPFNANAKEIFIWDNDPKITYLIDNRQ